MLSDIWRTLGCARTVHDIHQTCVAQPCAAPGTGIYKPLLSAFKPEQLPPFSTMTSFEPRRYHLPDDVEIFSLGGPSSNATTSDQPGPGRILDNALQSLGRRLERLLELLAMQGGYGPRNTALRIRDTHRPYERSELYERVFGKCEYSRSDERKQRKELKRLIGYAW